MSYNEQEFERLVNGETLDSDEITYKLALSLIKLAMIVLQERAVGAPYGASLLAEALDVLHLYGNWREEGPVRALLTPEEYRQFLIKDCGNEQEANAQIYYEAFLKKLQGSPAGELWYHDGNLWHEIEGYPYNNPTRTMRSFYYEQAPTWEDVINNDRPGAKHMMLHGIDALIREVREQYAFDVYTIPLDQWMFTPHGDIH